MENCKYCLEPVVDIMAEGLKCTECMNYVHSTCLRRGSVPGGLCGDIFFTFTCVECSPEGQELFEREKMPWLQVIFIALHHMSLKNQSLGRKGYFHWKMHVVTMLDKHWEVLFPPEFKKKKKWLGTISGCISSNSPYFFHSGTTVFGEQGWWTLTFPKLTPSVLMKVYLEIMARKQKLKDAFITDHQAVQHILTENNYSEEHRVSIFDLSRSLTSAPENTNEVQVDIAEPVKNVKADKPKRLLPSLDSIGEASAKKYSKMSFGGDKMLKASSPLNTEEESSENVKVEPIKFIDPMCHYNTSLNNVSQNTDLPMRIKLMGGMQVDTILSPYSSLYLKPYIRRDPDAVPAWIKLMAAVQKKANRNNPGYRLPKRAIIDYVYVQPSHIPAINSLCNQFFWPGIDLTECLQYPDFSCVVMYRKLIVGFAFVVPDTKVHENYISFVFVRPSWRNVGIARFMIYHLIQTSTGKDITLHVSINNPALILYQKFGFKVEHVDVNFYDKYYRNDVRESKHAFFCRLER